MRMEQKILIFGDPVTENIGFVFILIFGAPGKENIDFWCSGDRKYSFLVLQGQKILIFGAWGQKILIFGAPGIENIDFWCSGERENIAFWFPGTKY